MGIILYRATRLIFLYVKRHWSCKVIHQTHGIVNGYPLKNYFSRDSRVRVSLPLILIDRLNSAFDSIPGPCENQFTLLGDILDVAGNFRKHYGSRRRLMTGYSGL